MDSSVNSLYPIHQIGSDGFSWWIGQVETSKQDDPKRSGRFRVRIIGQHLKTGDNATPTEELPWAHTMMPVTTPYIEGGTGGASPGLKRGCFVVGFYVDNDKQKPIIMGSVGGVKNATKESNDDTGGPLNFKAVKDPEIVPQRDRSVDNQEGKGEDGGNTDKGVVDSDKADTKGGAPPILIAAYGKHSETNPTGGKSCVVIANPNCGQEKNLKSGLTRLMGDLLAANQASGGNIGDFYVSKINGLIYNQTNIARYHVGRVVRLVKSFISRSKSEIVKGIRGGIKALNDLLLTEEVVTGYAAQGPYVDPDKAFVPIKEKSNRFKAIKEIFDKVFEELGCSIADFTETIAKFITDLILGYLTDVFNNASCFIDTLVDGILNEIVGGLENIINTVLAPINSLLEAIAAPLNLIGGIISGIFNLLGISCTGPGSSCEPIQEKCVDCSRDDGKDALDDLLDMLESGIGDTSLFVCDEAKEVPQQQPTEITFIGGVYDEPSVDQTPDVPPYVSEPGINPPGGLTPTEPEEPIVPELPDDDDDDDDEPIIPADPEEDPTPDPDPIPDPDPNSGAFFAIASDKDIYEEGEVITYTITSVNVPDGTAVPLTLIGNPLEEEDFTEGLTGTATISGVTTTTDADGNTIYSQGTATFTRTSVIDGDPTVIVRCKLDNNPDIFTDVIIEPQGTFDDPVLPPDLTLETWAVTTDKTSYKEGEDVIVTVTTQNVPDGTGAIYSMLGLGVTPSDFVLNSLSGNFEVNNNTATIVVGIQDDLEIEGQEQVTLLLNNKGASTTFSILADEVDVVVPEDPTDPTEPDPDEFNPTKPVADKPITDEDGSIIEIPIKIPGGPYQTPPKVIITGPGYGGGAVALLDPEGFVSEVRVTRQGTNYGVNTPTENNLQCIIDSFTLISPGVGYTTAPEVLVDGEAGIAQASIDDRGYVVSVLTLDRKKRYVKMPKITFIGGGGAGARFLPNMACLDSIGLETRGYTKIGTGRYVDCP